MRGSKNASSSSSSSHEKIHLWDIFCQIAVCWEDYVYVPETAPPTASTTTSASITSTLASEKGDSLGCYNKYTPCGCPYPSFGESWCNEANSNLGIANQTCGISESVCLSQCHGKWCVYGLMESPTTSPTDSPVTTTTVSNNFQKEMRM